MHICKTMHMEGVESSGEGELGTKLRHRKEGLLQYIARLLNNRGSPPNYMKCSPPPYLVCTSWLPSQGLSSATELEPEECQCGHEERSRLASGGQSTWWRWLREAGKAVEGGGSGWTTGAFYGVCQWGSPLEESEKRRCKKDSTRFQGDGFNSIVPRPSLSH